MGTRADFYIKVGKNLVQKDWIGSIAWDGYPEGIDKTVLEAGTINQFKKACLDFFSKRDDYTKPEEGWPWPWDTSATTDYAYVYDNSISKVLISEFDKETDWPNMKNIQKVQFGDKSGLVIISAKNEA